MLSLMYQILLPFYHLPIQNNSPAMMTPVIMILLTICSRCVMPILFQTMSSGSGANVVRHSECSGK